MPSSSGPTSGTTTRWPADVKTLAIDIGGTGLKASVLDSAGEMMADRVRIDTPYPCPPERLAHELIDLVKPLPEYHRVSVGFPGLVRHGIVIEVPAFSRNEYGGPEIPALAQQWHRYDLAGALTKAFQVPVKVANDADVQACAVVSGEGFEFVMTLGTGVGTALFSDGVLLPHMDLSHAKWEKGQSYDIRLGNLERKRIGKKKWLKRVLRAIPDFAEFIQYDKIYIGGGNAKKLAEVDLPANATIVPNAAGILGGIRIWDLDQ